MFGKITIRTNILTNILLVVMIVSAGLLGVQYYFAKRMAYEATVKAFHQLSDKVAADVQARDRLARETLYLMERYRGITLPPTHNRQAELARLLATPMHKNNRIYAVYMGYGNGDLFEVVNLDSDADLRPYYRVPASGRWMVIKVLGHGGKRVRHFDFFDRNFRWLGHREEASDYAVTRRPWYTIALHTDEVVRGEPYLFYNLKKPGITFSKRLDDGSTVLALDFTLTTLDTLFQQLKFSPSGEIVMFGNDGRVFAASDTGKKYVDAPLAAAGNNGKVFRYMRDGRTRLAMTVPLRGDGDTATKLGFSVDESEMMKPYLDILYIELAAAMLILLLTLPLVRFTTGRIVRPIYALMDENEKIKQRRFDDIREIETNIIELERLSKSLVSMAGSIRDYQASQKRLLDGFIRLIADAIDAKSPYTGGHCKRVPVIAEMLAERATESREGPFAGFALEGEDAWKEFERGAWLHDCGKITTPEYVVDKATKLETIYNRIHEIRTRFEVIWRDIEIRYYERRLAGEDPEALAAWKAGEHRALLEDFAFVAQANLGGEYMDDEHKARIRRIASRTWIRHFDDRAGLSETELRRCDGVPERPAPAFERLLDDKPEHRIARTGFDETAYREQGFKTPVPELLYNYGEVYNLCVERGTLTPEERFKIEEHVIMTIRMLERLPFPENMKRIPEYAGTHHETLDGTGYPRQLTEKELSVPARIMAIADIFEALTASDRPYKKGKTLSEALKIMSFMVQDRHLDADLFALFLRSGTYLEYARRYLKPEQIDEVDIEALLNEQHGAKEATQDSNKPSCEDKCQRL